MIGIHLYGKLRRFAGCTDPTAQSVVHAEVQTGDTVGKLVDRLGIPRGELGSNVFLNGRYASLESPVQDEDRLGLFPDDMQLLYKWYFASSNNDSRAPHGTAAAEKPGGKPPHQASRNDQGARSES